MIARLEHLLEAGVLSRFGPMYDAERLGGGLTLAAMAVPEERFDEVPRLVNAYPGGGAQLRREHALNMWFVLATERPERHRARCSPRSRPQTGLAVLDMPKLEEYLLGAEARRHEPRPPRRHRPRDLRATQAGLPLTARPYHAIAERSAWTPRGGHGTACSRMLDGRDHPPDRRRAEPLRARATGPTACRSGMWRTSRSAKLGRRVGALTFVSHCYRRPRHLPLVALQPVRHGARPHARGGRGQGGRRSPRCSAEASRAHDVLYSTRILKKTGLRLAG